MAAIRPMGDPIRWVYFLRTGEPGLGCCFSIIIASGPLVYLRLFTQNVYVVNAYHVASEILDKNSSKSADRARAQVMVGEL